jgi:hypothetical protein
MRCATDAIRNAKPLVNFILVSVMPVNVMPMHVMPVHGVPLNARAAACLAARRVARFCGAR